MFNTFCFGYGIGYKFSKSKTGSANGNFLGLGADSCQRAVVVEQAQPPGLLISNGEFVGRWSSTNAVCLEVGPEVEGKVSLVNCSFWGPIDRCVWMRGAAGQFTASACHFVNWDVRGAGSPALQLDAGKSIVQGCTFNEENLHVQVGSNVTSVILTANQAAGGFRVENQAGKRAQIALNEEDAMEWTPAARSIAIHREYTIAGKLQRDIDEIMAGKDDAAIAAAFNPRFGTSLTAKDLASATDEGGVRALLIERGRAFMRKELTDLEQYVLIDP